MIDLQGSSLYLQLISANLMGLIFGSVIIWIAYRIGKDDGSYITNVLICILGGLIGWVLGVLATPLNTAEGIRFLTYTELLSVFASGYLVSKLDRFLEKTLFDQDSPSVIAWIRSGLFIAALISVLVPVFVNRSYLHAQREENRTVSEVNTLELVKSSMFMTGDERIIIALR